MCKLVMYTARK